MFMSASSTACLSCGYRRAGTRNDRLGRGLSDGARHMPNTHRYTCLYAHACSVDSRFSDEELKKRREGVVAKLAELKAETEPLLGIVLDQVAAKCSNLAYSQHEPNHTSLPEMLNIRGCLLHLPPEKEFTGRVVWCARVRVRVYSCACACARAYAAYVWSCVRACARTRTFNHALSVLRRKR